MAATRVALDLKRSAAPAPSGEDILADLVSSEPDPELRDLKTLHRAASPAAPAATRSTPSTSTASASASTPPRCRSPACQERTLAIPLHNRMTADDQAYVIDCVTAIARPA